MSQNSGYKPQIYIFDYDKVIVRPNPDAVDSMHTAAFATFTRYPNLPQTTRQKFLDLEGDGLKKIFNATSGTTEFTMFRTLCEALQIPFEPGGVYLDYFNYYIERRILLTQKLNDERGLKFSDEGNVYPDFLHLIAHLKQQDKDLGRRSIYTIGTGNPDDLLPFRVPPEVRDIMDIIVGGELGITRGDIIDSIVYSNIVSGLHDHDIHQLRVIYFDDSLRGIKEADQGARYHHYGDGYDIDRVWVNRDGDAETDFSHGSEEGSTRVCICEYLNEPGLYDFLTPTSNLSKEGQVSLTGKER